MDQEADVKKLLIMLSLILFTTSAWAGSGYAMSPCEKELYTDINVIYYMKDVKHWPEEQVKAEVKPEYKADIYPLIERIYANSEDLVEYMHNWLNACKTRTEN